MAQESWKREEEAAGCQLPEGPVPCVNNCGFFGSVATMNLCSQCYRQHQSKPSMSPTQPPPPPMSMIKAEQFDLNLGNIGPVVSSTPVDQLGKVDVLPPPSTPPPHGENVTVANDVVVAVVETPSSRTACSASKVSTSATGSGGDGASQRLPNRCFACRKRVGLTGFKCRCGDVFCSMHRYSDKHSCSFDYKAAGRLAIAKANPVVKADKIEKI